LPSAGGLEEGRKAENIFMCGKESLFAADDESDDRGGERAIQLKD
jgi:hypothetical protein